MALNLNFLRRLVRRESYPSPIPSRRTLHRCLKFQTGGGAENMNVDGSVTPVEFLVAPSPGEQFFVENINLILIDNGSADPDEFGSITNLTNGVQLLSVVDSIETQMSLLKTNIDVATCVGKLIGAGSSQGMFGTADWILSRFNIPQTPILLKGDNSDKLIFRIRDDLSSIDFLEASIQFRIVID